MTKQCKTCGGFYLDSEFVDRRGRMRASCVLCLAMIDASIANMRVERIRTRRKEQRRRETILAERLRAAAGEIEHDDG